MLPGIRSLAVAMHLEIYWVYINKLNLDKIQNISCYFPYIIIG
ncbi:hypothetical protein [Photorhabdus australis]